MTSTTDIINEFVSTLGPKVAGVLRGTARLDIADVGSVFLDETGAREGADDANVVLIASEQVFRDIMADEQNPVTAFMSRKLKVEGNPQRALKVSSILVG